MTYPTSRPILILDFGSQYTHLIARRIRACGVHCIIYPFERAAEPIKTLQPAGIILSGSPETATRATSYRAPEAVFQATCPVLGICYGMQTMAQQLGGKVSRGLSREGGYAQASIAAHSWLERFADTQDSQGRACLDVWMSHGDEVEQLPPGFTVSLSTQTTRIAAMADETRQFYGLQFHPEVTHTPQGKAILAYFVQQICHCPSMPYQVTDSLSEHQHAIQQTVSDQHVLLGLSGGVDSTVLAALLYHSIGAQLRCVFVDTGLVWETHRSLVRLLADDLHIPVVIVDAKTRFLAALKGIEEPEQKRKMIGRLFVEIFEEQANINPVAHFLAQGTILSDVIESAAAPDHKTQTIKSHHNVGGLPEQMQLQLLEPLRDLFKDEVAQLGLALGLPAEVLSRQPFPGPGLAIRIIGEVTEDRLRLLRQADAIFQAILKDYAQETQISQAFCLLLPINTVGVIGDARHYGPVIALRAIKTTDFMTAHWVHLPYDCLQAASSRIINEIPEISRVVYDISSKPPATIEWE